MTKPTRRENLIESVQYDLEGAQKTLAKWAEDYTKNPLQAFRWGDKAMEAAAEQEVLTIVLQFLQAEGPVSDAEIAQSLLKFAQERVFSGINDGTSTSPLSNESGRAVTRQWAQIANQDGWRLGSQLRRLAAGEV